MSAFPSLLRRVWPLAAIAALIAALAATFSWAAGWIGGPRLTAQRVTDAIEAGNMAKAATLMRQHLEGARQAKVVARNVFA